MIIVNESGCVLMGIDNLRYHIYVDWDSAAAVVLATNSMRGCYVDKLTKEMLGFGK